MYCLQSNNSVKKTTTPKTRVRIPINIAFFRIFFSCSVNSDHGFCRMSMAISRAIPRAVPIGMPITKPTTKSLILSTLYSIFNRILKSYEKKVGQTIIFLSIFINEDHNKLLYRFFSSMQKGFSPYLRTKISVMAFDMFPSLLYAYTSMV